MPDAIENRPYVSFVVTGRNDDYGGNFLPRMQAFVNVLLSLCDKHGLSAELVVVDWNPPEDKPPLWKVLDWPKDLKAGRVRSIGVSHDIHRRLANSARMPMFEYIAKNVGIRRARGEYLLATNPDLLYSDALMRFLASRQLSRNCFYRIDRYDISEPVPPHLSVEELLKFCAGHVTKVHTINVPVVPETRLSPQRLHMGAPGDFLLMAREHWHHLRGYPEFKSSSVIDCYACHMAAALGLQQCVLKSPLRIYHQEHDRSELHKRPRTDMWRYRREVMRMIELGRPTVFNGEDWGLGDDK